MDELQKSNMMTYVHYMFMRAERAHNFIWADVEKEAQEAVYLTFFSKNSLRVDEYFQFLLGFYDMYEPASQKYAMMGKLDCPNPTLCVMERLKLFNGVKKRKLN